MHEAPCHVQAVYMSFSTSHLKRLNSLVCVYETSEPYLLAGNQLVSSLGCSPSFESNSSFYSATSSPPLVPCESLCSQQIEQ